MQVLPPQMLAQQQQQKGMCSTNKKTSPHYIIYKNFSNWKIGRPIVKGSGLSNQFPSNEFPPNFMLGA